MSMGNPYGVGTYGSGKLGGQPIENLPLGYYIGLLASQYFASPKLNALLLLLLNKFNDASQCLMGMDTCFDLDYAVGVQLDSVGVIIGQSRTVGFQPSGSVSPVLTDSVYRILLKATVAKNLWNGTIDGIQSVWQSLFPGGTIIIEDQQNMTANIVLRGSFSSITVDLINNGYIVPRPEGVLYNYQFSSSPLFGFDLDNSFVAGFDTGEWI